MPRIYFMRTLKMKLIKYLLPVCALVPLLVDAQGVLEEVVVTAQKREQNLQEVPISVTAFSGEQMDALGLSDFVDITQQVPGLQLNTWSPKLTNFNLRGISQNTFNDNNEGPVAVYMDDAYLGSLNGVSGQLFDMERVEVLRGPQGTLFGRNATGGLIHYLSRDASDAETNGYLEGKIGNYDRYSVEGAAGGSLTENVRYRVSGRWNQADGYIKSLDSIIPGTDMVLFPGSGQDLGGLDGFALRGTLQVDFSEQLQGNFWVKYAEDNDVPTGGYVFENCPFEANGVDCMVDAEGRTITLGGVINFFGEPASAHDHYNEYPGFMNREQVSVTGRLNYTLDNGMELVSITNYFENDYNYDEDGDALPLPILTFQTFVDYNQWSQELRLSGETDRMRWQVGFYYLDMEWDGGTSVTGAPGFGQIVASGRILAAGGVDTALATANPFNGFEGALSFQNYVLDSQNWSAFGQFDYDVTDELMLTGGIRWSQDDKSMDWALMFTDNFNPTPLTTGSDDALAAINPGVNEIDYGDYALRVVLTYQMSEEIMLYGSVNRGIKGGNWSIGGTPNITASTFQHEEEILWSYEAGFKSGSDTFRLNGTFFYYDYTDYQAFSLAGGGPFISNAPDTTAYGGELEFFWYPTENWDVVLGGSFIDSEVNEVLGAAAIIPPAGGGPAGGVTISNAELPNAPSVSINYLVRYNWNAFNGNVAIQVDGAYYDDQFLEVTNGSGSFQEDYNVSNARLTYTDGGDRFSISGWVKNFTDETYKQYALDLGALGTTSYYAPPITYGVTARYNW